jgi:ArsR family transcriptional regulator, arsenate/arsenite/antimonite-responsive transcriptional repressor
MRDLADRFAALADATRLEMLALLLRHGELCVCDFVETLEIGQSKASRHLRYLWHAGFLVDRRAALWVYYRVTPDLDPDARILIAALGRVFGARDLDELGRRLTRWQKRKARTGAVCKPAPARKTRTRAETKR